MKILLAVPTFENITPDTFKSLWDMDKAGHEVIFETVRGYDCATARNKIAQKAIDIGADYVLMVDSDMVIPADTLVNFLDEPVPVCIGYCPRRSNHDMSAIYKMYQPNGVPHFDYDDPYMMEELREAQETRLRIHGGGMACSLIATDVFRRLEYPWFDWVNYKNKNVLSEDLYFCEQCKRAGIPVLVDTRVSCGHILKNTYY